MRNNPMDRQKLIHHILIFLLLTIFGVFSSVRADNMAIGYNYYYPNLEMGFKIGSERHLTRLGVLLPLLQKDNHLLFTNIFTVADTKQEFEGNFGLGYRRKIDDSYIIGGYGFWDVRRSTNANVFNQITLGAEYLRSCIEFRGNLYLPITKKKLVKGELKISRNYDGHQTLQKMIRNVDYEIALTGFDVEIGGHLPQLKQLDIFGAYYHFSHANSKADGFRVRTTFDLSRWLSLEAEGSYDNIREWVGYVGCKLHYSFDKKRYNDEMSILAKKMTQMTVRDIDVVTVSSPEISETNEEMSGFHPLLLAPEENIGGIKVIGEGNAVFLGVGKYKEYEKGHKDTTLEEVSVLSQDGGIISPVDNDGRLLPLVREKLGIRSEAWFARRKINPQSTFGKKVNMPRCRLQEFLEIQEEFHGKKMANYWLALNTLNNHQTIQKDLVPIMDAVKPLLSNPFAELKVGSNIIADLNRFLKRLEFNTVTETIRNQGEYQKKHEHFGKFFTKLAKKATRSHTIAKHQVTGIELSQVEQGMLKNIREFLNMAPLRNLMNYPLLLGELEKSMGAMGKFSVQKSRLTFRIKQIKKEVKRFNKQRK